MFCFEKPINTEVLPAGPPGLNSDSLKPEPIRPTKKVIEENITTTENNNEKEDKSSSTLIEKQTILAPPTTPITFVETTDESDMELQLQQELQAKLDPANHSTLESNDVIPTETPSLVVEMEVEGSEEKQAVAPSEINEPMGVVEEEIDPLDAYMNQLDDVRKVDDLKQKQKKDSEVSLQFFSFCHVETSKKIQRVYIFGFFILQYYRLLLKKYVKTQKLS